MAAYDYTNPSYRLTQADVIALLGEPEERFQGDLCYTLGDANNIRYGLLVQFQNELAVIARIDMQQRPAMTAP
jgi:hypothetical protein